ncbi:hypothetical protein ACQ4PT_013009 [Festuca glaucescens]
MEVLDMGASDGSTAVRSGAAAVRIDGWTRRWRSLTGRSGRGGWTRRRLDVARWLAPRLYAAVAEAPWTARRDGAAVEAHQTAGRGGAGSMAIRCGGGGSPDGRTRRCGRWTRRRPCTCTFSISRLSSSLSVSSRYDDRVTVLMLDKHCSQALRQKYSQTPSMCILKHLELAGEHIPSHVMVSALVDKITFDQSNVLATKVYEKLLPYLNDYSSVEFSGFANERALGHSLQCDGFVNGLLCAYESYIDRIHAVCFSCGMYGLNQGNLPLLLYISWFLTAGDATMDQRVHDVGHIEDDSRRATPGLTTGLRFALPDVRQADLLHSPIPYRCPGLSSRRAGSSVDACPVRVGLQVGTKAAADRLAP